MLSATQAVVGSRQEMATEIGPPCNVIGDPAVSLATSIGETLPELRLATSAVEPSGVMATAAGRCPPLIGAKAFPVARSTGVTVEPNAPGLARHEGAGVGHIGAGSVRA